MTHKIMPSQMKTVISLSILAVILLAMAVYAAPPPKSDTDLMLNGVPLREGVTSNIHIKVFVNEAHPCNDNSIITIHGMAHTAAAWGPFAEALFADNPSGRKVCRVFAVDLPGHGKSSIPNNLVYGNVTLEDYVQVIFGVLDRLNKMNLHADTLIGHSQGGLLIQLAQQTLKNEGTNLRERFDIKHAVLLAPAAAAPVPYYLGDSGTALQIWKNLGLIVNDPVLGTIISIPDTIFGPAFCSNLNGTAAPGTPSAAEVVEKGYNSPEPYAASSELMGVAPFTRLPVDAGIFDNKSGTRLDIVAYEQDQYILPQEMPPLYKWLTGETTTTGLVIVNGTYTVHDTHLTDPAFLLNSITGTVKLP